MLTKDDLNNIVQAIHPLIKAEADAIRQDMATKSDLRDLRNSLENKIDLNAKIFKIELAQTKQEIMHEVNVGFKNVATLLKDHEQRIQTLEEITLSKHKN